MSGTLIHGDFGRIAPLFKVRTVIRRRAARRLPGFALELRRGKPANGLSANIAPVEPIEDELALGWLDEEIRIRRTTGQLLAGADRELGELIGQAGKFFAGVKADVLQKLLFLTRLEAARGFVRQALVNTALCGLALLLFIHAVLPDDVLLARRGGRRLRRRDDIICLGDAETGEDAA
jgi:hypothetical protein